MRKNISERDLASPMPEPSADGLTADQERALERISELEAKPNLAKADLAYLPLEGEITRERLLAVLADLRQEVERNPRSAAAVLMLLEDREPEIMGTERTRLPVVGAEIFRGFTAEMIGSLLGGIVGEQGRVVVVGSAADNEIERILQIVQAQGHIQIPLELKQILAAHGIESDIIAPPEIVLREGSYDAEASRLSMLVDIAA